MPDFLMVVLALVLLASIFVLFPLMMNRSSVELNRSGINITLFKSRLAELQTQQQRGELDADEFQRLKTELERRLLDEESGAANSDSRAAINVSRTVALGLAVLIPIISYSIYHQTGALADWHITETLTRVNSKVTAGQQADTDMDTLLQQLTARLGQQPDNSHYLMLMANTQMQLQNYPAATDAYHRLSLIAPNDPSILGQYAQALYLVSERRLTDPVMAIANRVLELNPQQPTVLGMLGIASFERGDYQEAINHWRQLLPLLPQVSSNRQMIQAGIDRAKTLLAASGVEVEPGAVVANETAANETAATGGEASLQVEVALADGITADTDATVFVFARALSGPKMPLAVARLKVSDLPASVTLDNSMAMAPGLTLSRFEQVEVVARVSKNGIANRGSGDVEGKVSPVVVAADTSLSVIIDSVLP